MATSSFIEVNFVEGRVVFDNGIFSGVAEFVSEDGELFTEKFDIRTFGEMLHTMNAVETNNGFQERSGNCNNIVVEQNKFNNDVVTVNLKDFYAHL